MLAAVLPGARFVDHGKGHGHIAMSTAPELFATEVLRFLRVTTRAAGPDSSWWRDVERVNVRCALTGVSVRRTRTSPGKPVNNPRSTRGAARRVVGCCRLLRCRLASRLGNRPIVCRRPWGRRVVTGGVKDGAHKVRTRSATCGRSAGGRYPVWRGRTPGQNWGGRARAGRAAGRRSGGCPGPSPGPDSRGGQVLARGRRRRCRRSGRPAVSAGPGEGDKLVAAGGGQLGLGGPALQHPQRGRGARIVVGQGQCGRVGGLQVGVIEESRIAHGPAGIDGLIARGLALEPDPVEGSGSARNPARSWSRRCSTSGSRWCRSTRTCWPGGAARRGRRTRGGCPDLLPDGTGPARHA